MRARVQLFVHTGIHTRLLTYGRIPTYINAPKHASAHT